MMDERQLNNIAHPYPFPMYLTGSTTLAPGVAITITRHKEGGSGLVAASGTYAAIGNGLYEYTLGAGDVDTLGVVAFYATATGCDPTPFTLTIVQHDPFNLPTLTQIVNGVLNELLSGHSVSGSVAAALALISGIDNIVQQINVADIQIAPTFNVDTTTLELRHNDDYTGMAGGSVVISGINGYDLTDPNISKVFLSVKPSDDEGQDVVPIIGPLQSTALTQHSATFPFPHDTTTKVFSGVGFVFDVLLLYTDGTRRTAIYGPVVIADSVTPLGTT